jgi:nucleoid DNA-binding protein
MKQTEFIQTLADELKQNKKDTKVFVDAFIALIVKTVKKGDDLMLPELGKFLLKKVPAKPKREGRNPMTGETVMLPAKPASAKPQFRPSKKFKEALLGTPAKKK